MAAKMEGEFITGYQVSDSVQDQHRPVYLNRIRWQQGVRVDEMFEKAAAEEADAELKDPRRRLKWNPNIRPEDEEWKTTYAHFFDLSRDDDATVREVLDREFEEVQRLLIEPRVQDDEILRIQQENTEKYLDSLRETGTFAGLKNNLTTKLSMLRFGLPVEPMTDSNIQNWGKTLDGDDPKDDASGLPRVQRIMTPEKPLQFLDIYYERCNVCPSL